jgi:putative DNA modification/repair radical SAM protein
MPFLKLGLTMNLKRKLEILADAAKYDASCASSGSRRKSTPSQGGLGNTAGMGICHSYTPDGRCVSLLKILLTNFCVFDCTYCINRVSSDVERARFSVAEVVWLTMEFYRRNYIEGLFLSSGVLRTPDATMEEMIEVARRLREEERFGGYIHLKAVAGASPSLLLVAGRYADRLSANIELPSQSDLDQLAPAKTHVQIERSMADIDAKITELKGDSKAQQPRKGRARAPLFAPGGQSTQMIVGATPSSDSQILQTATRLYDQHHLRRVYYSAFSPIPDADPRLPLKAPPLIREHRLYQADWLLRFYGFDASEIAPPEEPNLDLEKDPKLAWALRNRHAFPVDVNKATRDQLLRVPGFGVRNVERILTLRRHVRITTADLIKLRVSLKRAQYFIVTADSHTPARLLERETLPEPAQRNMRQMTIFEVGATAATGEF